MFGIDAETVQNFVSTQALPMALALAQAIGIFIIGRIIVSIIISVTGKLLGRTKLDPMLIGFMTSILKFLLLLVVIIAALNELGVDTTSLVALIGAAGLAIGLALQGSLQNFSSGAMLIFFKPFGKGDFVEINGTSGTVEEIHLFNTQLRTPDNKRVIIPNGQVFGNTMTNYSSNPTRRVDMVFGIGYDDDIDKARALIKEILDADDRVLDEPEPLIAISALADSSVNFNVRPWVNTADYWSVFYDTHEAVKKSFDKNGVGIPYPQMDVHVHKTEPGKDDVGQAG